MMTMVIMMIPKENQRAQHDGDAGWNEQWEDTRVFIEGIKFNLSPLSNS